MTKSVLSRPQFLVAVAVFLVALGVYSSTMGPTINFWDCGEFVTTSHIVGIPHQPGTPLYVLVGRVFDILLGQADITRPSYETARALNFMSAFFSALAVAFIYLLIWELARRSDPDAGWLAHAGGIVGAFFLAFSETFWNNAIEAEVYGLSMCLTLLAVWLALRWDAQHQDHRSDYLLLFIAYLFGLGAGVHLQCLLTVPGILILVSMLERRVHVLADEYLLLLLEPAGERGVDHQHLAALVNHRHLVRERLDHRGEELYLLFQHGFFHQRGACPDAARIDLAHGQDCAARCVAAGGDARDNSEVDEEVLLKLERDAFVDLFKEEKTVARVEHMLATGKPLRN